MAVAVLALVLLTTAGCSAVALYQDQSSAAAGSAAATADPTVSALEGALAEIRASEQSLSAGATQAAATITALESTPTNAPTAAAIPAPASAETTLFGSVPIDSDRLNIIAALGFDADGQLLAATRAGEIYVLPDRDGDGVADETRLIFADEAQQLSQVAGLIARGEALILLNGPRLSLLRDRDGDGVYDGVTQLAGKLPADQSPLQASNGLVESPDGRLFTVDIQSGEILQIFLRE
ncbi:MAG: hypothetical protein OXG68_20575 [Chloroflexi bacterium]|nr:hypothetical protein [Chloroflexota bacterium]